MKITTLQLRSLQNKLNYITMILITFQLKLQIHLLQPRTPPPPVHYTPAPCWTRMGSGGAAKYIFSCSQAVLCVVIVFASHLSLSFVAVSWCVTHPCTSFIPTSCLSLILVHAINQGCATGYPQVLVNTDFFHQYAQNWTFFFQI